MNKLNEIQRLCAHFDILHSALIYFLNCGYELGQHSLLGIFHIIKNRFGGVMVSVLASSEAQIDRIKQTTNTIVIYCFSTKHVA